MRKVTQAVSRYSQIDHIINEILLSFEKIDRTLIAAYNSEIDNKDKFALIKKDVDDIALSADRFNKKINNVFSKSIKKINQTFYYYEKSAKFLNLFVEAFKIVSNDKFDFQNSSENLDPILKKLSTLLNSIDENENKVFTNSNLEIRVFRLYNRIVGYRHTSRGIAMLHSIIELTIKKMVAMKSETSTLKISEQTSHIGNLNGRASNTVHVASRANT